MNYLEAIKNLASNKEDFVFIISGIEKGEIVVSSILDNSNSIVRIFTHEIEDQLVSDNSSLIKALNDFLLENKKLRLVIESVGENSDSSLEYLRDFVEKYPENIEFREASHEFLKGIEEGLGKVKYFTTGDDHSYRLEFNKLMHRAKCNFFDKKKTSKLNSIFDQYFLKCKTIQLE